MVRQRSPRKHDEAHLGYIRSLPCCVCRDNTSTEAAHVKMAEPKAGKRGVGIGEKADDRWCVPLCGKHHRLQHKLGETPFWWGREMHPVFLALALHSVSGDHEVGCDIIEAYHS